MNCDTSTPISYVLDYGELNITEIYDYNDSFDFSQIVPPCDKGRLRTVAQSCLPTVLSLICALGLIGNGLVIVTYVFYKNSKSMTDVYLLNVAVADIFLVLTLPFWAAYHHAQTWQFGTHVCRMVKGLYDINFYCSMLLLAFISIDRYIAIVQATRSFRLRAKTFVYSRAVCAVIWCASVLVSVPTFMYSEAYCFSSNRFICDFRYPMNNALVLKLVAIILPLCLGFLFPLLIMFFCYAFVIGTLLQAKNFQKHKAVRVVIAVVVVFLVCNVPYNVILLIEAIRLGKKNLTCEVEQRLTIVTYITESLAYFHCCLNPLLYAFIGVRFRNYFLRILQDLWCLSKKYITVRRSSRLSSDVFSSKQTNEMYDSENASSFTM
ncbi:C-C chemokine receptor type 6 [Protopterus annectens]|uniref:C-C chemokine receptor type 6 n=1 Tax=Protopterus annectens TaxID=7888 RepID=UPI001CFAADA2|nr:C-C chemokine receptor type 6 [Protopterus annectens]